MTTKEAYDIVAKHVFLAASPYNETFDPIVVIANDIDDARKKIDKHYYGVHNKSFYKLKCIDDENQIYDITCIC